MSIKKKSDVLKNITLRTKIVGGKKYAVYNIYFGTDHAGRKVRTSKPSEKEAKQYIEDFYAQYREHGNTNLKNFNAKNLYEFSEAKKILSDGCIDLPLQEIAREYIRLVGGINKRALADAYHEYYNSFSDEQKMHKLCIRKRVLKWIVFYGSMNLCSNVSTQELEQYIQLNLKDYSPRTKNNIISYIKSFFEWCANPARRYILQNPLKNYALQKIAYREPEYMKAADVDRLFSLLKTGSGELVVYAALSWFCGIRNAEIGRLEKKDINLEDGIVRISRPKGWTQGVMPRIINIPENAHQWLEKYDVYAHIESCHKQSALIQRIFRRGKRAGLAMPLNAGRHSFITHHAAAYGEPAKTEAMAGTSQRMRVFHYQGLVPRKEGERYFAIVP